MRISKAKCSRYILPIGDYLQGLIAICKIVLMAGPVWACFGDGACDIMATIRSRRDMDDTRIQPTLLFSILCDDIRREENGKFILIGLFEAIGASSFPVRHPTLYVMNCWCSGIGTFKQHTRIVTVDNVKLIEDDETEFSLPDLKAKHRIVARFNNIHFQTAGEYAVEVLLNGELKVRYPLLIRKVKPGEEI